MDNKKSWDEAHKKNKAAMKNKKRNIRDEVAKSLGLIKVRGSVSGKIYYE